MILLMRGRRLVRLERRLAWYRDARADPDYLFTGFSLQREWRCTHRSRFLGVRCFRERAADGWCALHNEMCWHHWKGADRCREKWW